MIIAGHGVKIACERAGLTQIRTVLWDVDQATADAFMLGDNRLAELGGVDADCVRELLHEYGLADVEAIGFSAAEVEELRLPMRPTTSRSSRSRPARRSTASGSR